MRRSSPLTSPKGIELHCTSRRDRASSERRRFACPLTSYDAGVAAADGRVATQAVSGGKTSETARPATEIPMHSASGGGHFFRSKSKFLQPWRTGTKERRTKCGNFEACSLLLFKLGRATKTGSPERTSSPIWVYNSDDRGDTDGETASTTHLFSCQNCRWRAGLRSIGIQDFRYGSRARAAISAQGGWETVPR